MTDHHPTSHQTPASTGASAELEQTLLELVTLGKAWTGYGLNAGKHALEMSARSQETLARLLGELAAQIKSGRKTSEP